MSPEEYLVVEARMKKELGNLRQLEDELAGYKLFPRIATTGVGGFDLADSAVCRIIGSILHDYYTAVENIFKVVATRIDKTNLSGEQWYKELLEQMTLEVPGVRPPLITRETAQKLDQLRVEKGMEKGRQETLRENVLKLLHRKFKKLPVQYTEKIKTADEYTLGLILDHIFEINTVADLDEYL